MDTTDSVRTFSLCHTRIANPYILAQSVKDERHLICFDCASSLFPGLSGISNIDQLLNQPNCKSPGFDSPL